MKSIFFTVIITCLSLFAFAQDLPYLGIFVEDVPKEIVQTYGIEGAVKIVKVNDNSPASEAGLTQDMWIISIDDFKILNEKFLVKALSNHKPGDKVKINIQDQSRLESTYLVTLGDKNSVVKTPAAGKSDWMMKTTNWIGVNVIPLTSQLEDFFKVKNGVLITEVIEDSPADKEDLKAGDIIVIANGTKINSVGDWKYVLKNVYENGALTMEINRTGMEQARVIDVEKRPDKQSFYFEYDPSKEIFLIGPDVYESEAVEMDSLKGWLQQMLSKNKQSNIKDEIESLEAEVKKLRSKIK
jgi:predicted metalloprotease with PDZ domain